MLSIRALLDALDAGYTARNKETFNPCPVRGSAIGACPRKLATLLDGAERNPIPPRSLRVLQTGTDRGIDLAKAMSTQYPARCSVEVETWTPLAIKGDDAHAVVLKATKAFGARNNPIAVIDDVLCVLGHLDLMIDGDEPSSVDVIDFKTKASYGFRKLGDEGNSFEYQCQGLAYTEGLRRAGLNVTSFTFIYENSDSRDLKAVPLDLEDMDLNARYDQQKKRIEAMLVGWLAGTTAVTNSTATYADPLVGGAGNLPWQCNYCAVGPIKGKCVPESRLSNANASKPIPKWVVTP